MSRTRRWIGPGLTGALCWMAADARAQELEGSPAPVPVIVVDGDPTAPAAPDVRPGKDGGEPGLGIAVWDDDALPLPQPPHVVASDRGDVLKKPRTGDPYFLGFAAGAHRPPADERLDPLLGEALVAAGVDGRPADEVYAFVMMGKRITPERVAALEALGMRHLGYHPYACLRAAIPVAALQEVANHPDVRWVGAARAWQKVHPRLAAAFAERGPEQRLRVYVNLFESDLNAGSTRTERDGTRAVEAGPGSGVQPGHPQSVAWRWQSNGWQQRALERQGVRVHEYVPELDAFVADLTFLELQRILPLDFVQFVESELLVRPYHDESAPMILADSVRALHDGGTNKAALVGEIDSGVRITHEMLSHIHYVGWDVTGSAGGVFSDTCDHGTHVLGTILGKPPSGKAGHTGMAPGLGWGPSGRVRIVKYLEEVGAPINDCAAILPVQIPLSFVNSPYNDGTGNVTDKPHVVNNSWGADPEGLPWIGSEYIARSLDHEVFLSDVLHVASAGNAGPGAGSIGVPAAAKNVLAVGSVNDFGNAGQDPGTLSDFSARGPCGDGRWKPNVVAPGWAIKSATSSGNTTYDDKSGTSMASPHVTGVVAQLVDRHSFLRHAPARISSLLMATATTKDNVTLSTVSSGHLDQYGAGRVDAYRAAYETSQMEWTNWGFDQLPGTWRFGDFNVGAGATRLVVVMHYVESPVSAGANKSLLNDFDLYIDEAPVDTVNGNTGEYTAQQSSVDNTEIRAINNPAAGPWRWKTFPVFTLTAVKMSVTVHVIYGDLTPDGSLTVGADDVYVKPGENVTVTATVTNPEFVASAVFLDAAASAGVNVISSSTTLDDGVVTDLTDNVTEGLDVVLGNVRHGSARTATWVVNWPTSGTKAFLVDARSDNWVDKSQGVTIYVDGGLPGQVGSLQSTTHLPNVWSNQAAIGYSWTPANDAISGVAGYSILTSANAGTAPDTLQDIGPITSHSETLSSSASGRWFKIRAVDQAGNWGSHAQVGPFLIDNVLPGVAVGLTSPSHAPNVWSNDPSVDFQWQAAGDSHSGLDGYGIAVSLAGPALPGTTKDVGPITSLVQVLNSSTAGYTFSLRAVDKAGNWSGGYASSGPYFIDSVDPDAVSGLASTTHTANQWSSETQATFTWGAASDAHSGLKGYAILVSTSPTAAPGTTQNLGTVASHSATLATSAAGHYFKIRSLDVAGNADDQFLQVGPFLVDAIAPGSATNLSSPSHSAAWNSDPKVTVQWTAATDGVSGLAGYRTAFTHQAGVTPTGALNTAPEAVSKVQTLGDGEWYFAIQAEDQAGNDGPAAFLGPLRVDATPPFAATKLTSTTHVPNQAVIDPVITMTWNAAVDKESGLDGYIALWDQKAATEPGGSPTLDATETSWKHQVTGNGAGWYFHLRPVDKAGNLGPTVHAGPYLIVACVDASNATYGAGKPGTHGVPILNPLQDPVLGQTSTVMLENGLPGALPILFLGITQQNIPFDGGALLTEATWILALPFPILADGTLPLTGALPSDPKLCGFKLYHQVMFADPGAAGWYHLAQTPGLVRTFGY